MVMKKLLTNEKLIRYWDMKYFSVGHTEPNKTNNETEVVAKACIGSSNYLYVLKKTNSH